MLFIFVKGNFVVIISNCFFNSSGVSDLLALYSLYNSFLNVGPLGSKTKARWVGFKVLSNLKVVLKKPYIDGCKKYFVSEHIYDNEWLEYPWEIKNIKDFDSLKMPLMYGVSNKSFIGTILKIKNLMKLN